MPLLSVPGASAQTTHAQLDALLDRVLELEGLGDTKATLEAWRVFERETRVHLAQEEGRLVPAYARHDAERAERIEIEHDAIREAMRACRHALERGEAEGHWLDDVIQSYRAHQQYEEATMYDWARGASAQLHT